MAIIISNILTYSSLFIGHFWPLFIGGFFFGFDKFAPYYSPRIKAFLDRFQDKYRKALVYVSVLLCLFISGYQTWIEEHTAHQKLQKEIGKLQIKKDRNAIKAKLQEFYVQSEQL